MAIELGRVNIHQQHTMHRIVPHHQPERLCAYSRPRTRAPTHICSAQGRTAQRSNGRSMLDTARAQQQWLDPEAVARAQMQDSSFQVHTVQWYPGHIAKAERQLKEQLKMVDVVLEVRDARIPKSTCHPQVPLWIGAKPRLIVINRQDMISRSDRAAWDKHFTTEAAAARAAAEAKAAARRKKAAAAAAAIAPSQAAVLDAGVQAAQQQSLQEQQQQQEDNRPPPLPEHVFWTDGKAGPGVHALRRAALKLSEHINAKRAKRDLAPRPIRACVIGFPNIGKSALINRLLGRRVVESAARPGVTRVLRWVRLGGELDLLDAPGIIPATFNDQAAAQALAICNDIGEASYVSSLIAAAMLIRFKALPKNKAVLAKLQQRYKVDPRCMSAEEFVLRVAGELFQGDTEKAGVRLLNDYRNGILGNFALELPGL